MQQDFKALCTDAMWPVRKACAAAFPDLLSAVARLGLQPDRVTAVQRYLVVDVYLGHLAKDVSQWVRAPAAGYAGPIISATDVGVLQEAQVAAQLVAVYGDAAGAVGSGAAAAHKACADSFLRVCEKVSHSMPTA